MRLHHIYIIKLVVSAVMRGHARITNPIAVSQGNCIRLGAFAFRQLAEEIEQNWFISSQMRLGPSGFIQTFAPTDSID